MRHELDRIPLWRGNDVGIKQLAEDVAKYLYLPQLRDEDVLLAAIRDGLARATWQADSFAYAEAWDEQKQRYVGLRGGTVGRILIDATSRLVKPDVAAEQLKAEQSERDSTAGATGGITDTGTSFQSSDHGHNERDLAGGSEESRGGTTQPAPQRPRRFHGSVKLDSLRSGLSASKVADEVIKHLTSIVGANVEVTLEIHAEIPDGVSPEVVRIVTENCRTLRFDSQGFEES